ncbi:MAG TPA: DMT family transporter [Candidatus Acidoferrum sp.]|nr:DMT family transporter [Candidatus Acidoferrum sp.]
MSTRTRADLSLAFCSLLWGVTFVVVKNALSHASVFLFLAVRFSVAAALMLLWSFRTLRQFEREDLFAGIRLGFFMFMGYAFQTAGLQYTTPSKSGFVTGSSVVVVPLLLALFWGKRLTWGAYAGAFVAVLGLYYLTIPAQGIAFLNRGDVLTFVAAGLYAVHIILVGEYTQHHSAKALSLIQVAGCAGMAWLTAGAAAAIRWQPVRFDWRWELYAGILICAVFATAVAFSIQLWAQQYTSSSHAAILFTLEPVFAVITSYLLIGERLGQRAILGAVFVLMGILVAELLGPPAAPESPEPTFSGRIYFEPWWRL